MAKRLVLKSTVCPQCAAVGSIRKILWGLPDGPPDPSEFVTGGCCPPEVPANFACIECDWSGLRADLVLSVRESKLQP